MKMLSLVLTIYLASLIGAVIPQQDRPIGMPPDEVPVPKETPAGGNDTPNQDNDPEPIVEQN